MYDLGKKQSNATSEGFKNSLASEEEFRKKNSSNESSKQQFTEEIQLDFQAPEPQLSPQERKIVDDCEAGSLHERVSLQLLARNLEGLSYASESDHEEYSVVLSDNDLGKSTKF